MCLPKFLALIVCSKFKGFPETPGNPPPYVPGFMGLVIRHVHTNPLKCTLDQIISSCFELIRIRSVHTLFAESKDCQNIL